MKRKFEVSGSNGRLSQIRDWMAERHLPSKLVFVVMGIISTIWFLIRVIPKPSRAAYPCMRVAAPMMSGFVGYLLTLGGVVVFFRKARRKFLRARYIAAGSLFIASLILLAVFFWPERFYFICHRVE